jgi:L-malate glycosyltransferase
MTRLIFIWDNFGPLHADRCDAVASHFDGTHEVIGVELASKSNIYDWVTESGLRFRKITLVQGRAMEEISGFELFRRTIRACLSMGSDAQFFFCHYQAPAIFACAVVLRLFGRQVYAMGCSKFDDYDRTLKREVFKSFFYLPYVGGIASGKRSCDYMRFLGIPKDRIASPYNAVSLFRIRAMADVPPAPDGVAYAERHFTIVARLVEKKNLQMALDAYVLYRSAVNNPRSLHIFGEGGMKDKLEKHAAKAGIAEFVHFHGFLQTDQVSQAYARSVALLLPSIEEQFGNVVPEAMGMGLPVIVSDNCGARDLLVRSGVNGFVIESDNPEGLAYFMKLIGEDEMFWRRLATEAREYAEKADSPRFAEAVATLVKKSGKAGN